MSPTHVALAAMAYLLAKHAIADFALQTQLIYNQKGIYGAPGGLLHAFIHILLTLPVFLLFPTGSVGLAALLLAGEFIVHYHIDWAKEQIVRQYGWKLLPLSVASGVGGFIGGRLLLMTGNALFRTLLPWLLLFAAVMFVLSFPLGRWLQTLSGGERYNKWLLFGMVIVSVYVGYFGAGGGFLVMALFGLCGVHDIHEMNALKVITAAVSIGIPAISFILAGRVQWHFCLEMAILAAIGGYLGAHYSRKVNQRAMRWTVAAIGFLTAGYFFMQNYMLRHG